MCFSPTQSPQLTAALNSPQYLIRKSLCNKVSAFRFQMKKQYFFLVKTKNKQTQEVPETDLIIVRKDKYRIFDYYENNSAGL